MIIKLTLGFIRITFTIAPVQTVVGINSNIDDKKKYHILMWDFHRAGLVAIHKALRRVQVKYKLPKIYIFESSPLHYHAYSFRKVTFLELLKILCDTEYIDEDFVRFTAIRKCATLRITEKDSYTPRLVKVMRSYWKEDSSLMKLKNIVFYETLYRPWRKYKNKYKLLEKIFSANFVIKCRIGGDSIWSKVRK